MVCLAAWNVFLLLALEFRFTACIPNNESSVSVTDTMTTVPLTASTSGPLSDHTSKTSPAKVPRRSANSTEPPSENTTLLSTSSNAIHTRPHSDPPAESSGTRAPSTNGTRRTTAMSIISTRPPSAPPAESSGTRAPSTNGTRRTTAMSIISTRPPSAPPAESSSTRAPSTNGTRRTTAMSIISTRPPSAPPAESSSTRASSLTNDTRRTTIQSIISTSLPNDSYSTPAVRIPGGSSAGPGPVTKQPCPTSTAAGTGPSRCAPGRGGAAGQCLLAVGVLASVLTVFMVSTAVLCNKLSTRKYSFERQTGTEMVCISAVMPERSAAAGGHGTLLRSGVDDSDEDGGDNLTLNSFLPDGDRMV